MVSWIIIPVRLVVLDFPIERLWVVMFCCEVRSGFCDVRLSSLYINPADSLCECTNIQGLIQSLHERELVQLKLVASGDHARLRGWPEKTNQLDSGQSPSDSPPSILMQPTGYTRPHPAWHRPWHSGYLTGGCIVDISFIPRYKYPNRTLHLNEWERPHGVGIQRWLLPQFQEGCEFKSTC